MIFKEFYILGYNTVFMRNLIIFISTILTLLNGADAELAIGPTRKVLIQIISNVMHLSSVDKPDNKISCLAKPYLLGSNFPVMIATWQLGTPSADIIMPSDYKITPYKCLMISPTEPDRIKEALGISSSTQIHFSIKLEKVTESKDPEYYLSADAIMILFDAGKTTSIKLSCL